jgi:hypothetical protein
MAEIDISLLDRCSDRQLKELLALASTDVKLTRNSLLDIGDMEQLECVLSGMCTATGQSAGAPLQVICSPQTPIESLTAVKDTAKRLAAAAEGHRQKAAATLLYHLSIASALGQHRTNISSKDPSEHLILYKDLAAELSDDQLAAIFENAIANVPSATD